MGRQSAGSVGNGFQFYDGLIDTLVGWATSRLELNEQQDDGLTLEEHLLNFWRQSGVMPPELEVQPLPVEIAHTWEWWVQLQETRHIGQMPCHITYEEIRSWSLLLQLGVTAFEVRCLMAIDTTCIKCSRAAEARRSAAMARKTSARPPE